MPEEPTPTPTTDTREVRWGGYWLPCIGIIVLLTGLVFLANYTYRGSMGPLESIIKLVLMYGGSLGLFWVGLRLERNGQVNPGRVLISGACGAVFYTTFAACYVASPRVVPSPLLDAVLLLACAGWMVWLAERRQSQPMALLAVVLAYYTTVVTPYTGFTLSVNFILAAAAGWFLYRHGWSAISFTILIATYLRFAQWKLINVGRWDFVHYLETGGNFWVFNIFFAAYWAMFTLAVLRSQHESFTPKKRALFFSLSNFFYWGLVSLALRAVDQTWVWKFTVGFGVVLVVVSRLAAWMHRNNSGAGLWPASAGVSPAISWGGTPEWQAGTPAPLSLSRLWLSEGLVLVTFGLAFHFAKGEPALILALLGVTFLLTGYYSETPALRAIAYLLAAVSVVMAWTPAHETTGPRPWYAVAVGAVMVFSAWWVNQSRKVHPGFSWNSAFYSALGLFLWFAVTEAQTPRLRLPGLLAVEAALLMASLYVLKVREVPVLAQFYLMAAQYVWLFDSEIVRPEGFQPMAWLKKMGNYAGPGLISFAVIIVTLGTSRWWETQRNKLLPETAVRFLQALYALVVVGLLLFWLRPLFATQPNGWMVTACALSIGTLLYGLLAHDWYLAAFGQLFTLQALGVFWLAHYGGAERGYVALAPVLTLIVIPRIIAALRGDAPAKADWHKFVHWMSGTYFAVAALMFIAWVISDVRAANQFLLLQLCGFILLVWAKLKREPALLIASLAFTTAAVFVCWRYHVGVGGYLWRDLFAFALLLLGQQLSKIPPDDPNRPPQAVQDMAIIIGIGSLWHWVHLWVKHHWGAQWSSVRWPDSLMIDWLPWMNFESSPIVTMSWAMLGVVVFGIGVVFKERMYRNLGLVILGTGVARAFLVDARQLATAYRFLSFFVLGGALLLLGFAYSKFRERFEQA